jgi:hypothetical protein
VYPLKPGNVIPLETGRLASVPDLTPATHAPQGTSGNLSLPDIAASFKAFDQSLTAPQRDPRQYTGGLLAPDQAAALNAARAARIDQANRFETGFAGRLWQDGHDGMPKLTGGEIPRAAFNNGATQTQDINQWGLMRRPGAHALKNYAITNLVENALLANGTLSAHKANRWTQGRSEAIKGLLSKPEQKALASVVADAQRASNAENLGRATGSNTAQNLEGGMLFGKPINLLRGVPYLGAAIGAGGLDYVRNTVKASRARQMQDLLLNPRAMADALGPRQYDPFYMPEMPAGGLLGLSNVLNGNP